MTRQPSDPAHLMDPSRRELLRLSLLTVGFATTAVPGFPATWFQEAETVVPFTDIPANFTTQRSDAPEAIPGQNLVNQDLRASFSPGSPRPRTSTAFSITRFPSWIRLSSASACPDSSSGPSR